MRGSGLDVHPNLTRTTPEMTSTMGRLSELGLAMHVHAVNTLEIRIKARDSRFEEKLHSHVRQCGQASGCLGYALDACEKEPGVWFLSGHWESNESLTTHYEDDSLQALLAFLLSAGATLQFALTHKAVREAGKDGAG